MSDFIRLILNRVERRELQVDVALSQIHWYFEGGEGVDPFPVVEDVTDDAVQEGVPDGTLTSYNSVETRQSRSTEPLPLSDDQQEELMDVQAALDSIDPYEEAE